MELLNLYSQYIKLLLENSMITSELKNPVGNGEKHIVMGTPRDSPSLEALDNIIKETQNIGPRRCEIVEISSNLHYYSSRKSDEYTRCHIKNMDISDKSDSVTVPILLETDKPHITYNEKGNYKILGKISMEPLKEGRQSLLS